MRTQEMRRAIADNVKEEQRTHKAVNGIRTWARQLGMNVSEADIEQSVRFVQEYIEHVPAVLEATEAAARERGLLADADTFLRAAEQYWFEEHDVFPDHQGLLGLADDAYVCLSVIQAMSANLQARTGRPLISLDLSQANAVARHLIGEPFATQLDAIVQQIMGGPMVQAVLDAMYRMGASMPTYNVPDPIWGNASIDEIVNARLGAMGVV